MDLDFMKQRAREYIDLDQLPQAHASITSDLRKNPATEHLLPQAIAMTKHLAGGISKKEYTEWLDSLK
jgi:hypothetical protein